MKKILVVELNDDSKDKMMESFVEDKEVEIKCKVLEMHRDISHYKAHLEQEKENKDLEQ